MGLFNMLKNSVSETMAKQKEKMDKAYEKTMDVASLEYGLDEYEKSVKRGDNMSAMGCLRAIRMLSEEASDEALKCCYDTALQEKSIVKLKALQGILYKRDLLEKDGERYEKTW